MKIQEVKSFRRIFKYIWPQWPRLIAVVFSAVMIGVLFSLSFATVIPLLKVMMGEEGLHSWVDRKTCDWRYGMDFYVPDRADFIEGTNEDIAYCLVVTKIDEEGQAYKAGLRLQNIIVGVGEYRPESPTGRVLAGKLLEALAAADDNSEIEIQLGTIADKGDSRDVLLKSLAKPDDISPEEWGFARRVDWGFKWAVINHARWATGFLPRGNIKTNQEKAVVFIIIAMGIVTIARCTLTFCQKFLAEKVVQIAIARLREDLFAHVMMMPVGYFTAQGTSDTISRLLGDTAGLGKGVKILLGKALREPLKAICCLGIAFLISWELTVIFLCAAPVVIALLGILGRKIKKATRRSLISSAHMLGKVQGTFEALRVVKVYNQQEQEIGSFGLINRKFLKHALRIVKVQAATGPVMDILGMFAGSAALMVGAHWVTGNQLDSSSFFGLLVLLGTSAESVRKASDVWNSVQEANAAAERVYAVVDTPPEIEQPDAFDLEPVKDTIEFRDITFTYPGCETAVLKKVNLTVKAGSTVAIVGPNGSGKTTLANLIPRFYDADSGRVLFDGQDIRYATIRSLRDQIGMVTQNVVTFNNTVAANIAYGKPEATRQEIIGAAMLSFSHEFIEPLPDGYDTVIGEHSSGFSGGQLQRLVIARAVIKNPAILIFDEAMSQIDADSEAKIQSALSELMKGRTCFIIAHRFSTVISADSIIVMDAGEIVAQGRHNDLMQTCSLYQNLYETQLVAPE